MRYKPTRREAVFCNIRWTLVYFYQQPQETRVLWQGSAVDIGSFIALIGVIVGRNDTKPRDSRLDCAGHPFMALRRGVCRAGRIVKVYILKKGGSKV
jgi:hypothetical protein